MKIYLDLIIIINFIYDFLILSSTSILLKRNIPLIKIILGSLIGILSMITLFVSLNKLFLLLFKIILSILMILITFGKKNFLENIFYFYIITIILGGSQYLFKGDNYQINIILMLIISPIILTLYIKSIREYKISINKIYDVIIIDGDNSYKLNGYMDTGNTLIDPITKYPVLMINNTLDIKNDKYFYVPYQVVNKKDILRCIKVDKVIINNHSFKCLLGLCDKSIFKDGIDVILNENIREMI